MTSTNYLPSASSKLTSSSCGTTPILVSSVPSCLTNAHAGCDGMSYSLKIKAAVSSRLSKVNEWRSMNSRYELSDPFQATPTTRTFPLNFLPTSSTEGASRLQVPQPGAQNQKTTGLSASAVVREKDVCVPMIFAEMSSNDAASVIDGEDGTTS